MTKSTIKEKLLEVIFVGEADNGFFTFAAASRHCAKISTML